MNKKEFNASISVKDNCTNVLDGFVQNDTGNIINMYIMDGAEPFDFTGYDIMTVKITMPNGKDFIDSDKGCIDTINPLSGLVSLVPPASCVAQVGMHFITITIYSNGARMTTARLNYYVMSASDSTVTADADKNPELPVLIGMLQDMSKILDSEKMRSVAEGIRQQAEANRSSETAGIIASAQAMLVTAQNYVNQVKDWYTVFMSNASSASGVDLSTVVSMTQLNNALADIDCGEFTGTSKKVLHILRGPTANIPTLAAGELGYDTVTGMLLIGTASGNKVLNSPCFIVQASAPADTGKLWIDSANGNALKFYNGSAWVGTSTAVFA